MTQVCSVSPAEQRWLIRIAISASSEFTTPHRKGVQAVGDNKITITLTDRQPVTVNKDIWPIIARASDHDNQYDFQANRRWKLFVRQCQKPDDDRCVVYGIFETQFSGESELRGGMLVDSLEEVPAAVKQVAKHLGFPERLADDCIADLPPVEL